MAAFATPGVETLTKPPHTVGVFTHGRHLVNDTTRAPAGNSAVVLELFC